MSKKFLILTLFIIIDISGFESVSNATNIRMQAHECMRGKRCNAFEGVVKEICQEADKKTGTGCVAACEAENGPGNCREFMQGGMYHK